ncbi:phosphotransferase family protein [Kitasatospora phosalacinea]|uniref:phosphotransferase family protein n=1 Tax=Kitasatospora phosalacinea TaxID=2065 RepID=UPI0036693E08
MTEQRTATVVVEWQGELLGAVGPFAAKTPHWAQVGEVAAVASRAAGVPLAVLRLLAVTGGEGGRGGEVVYLAVASERPTGALAAVPGPGGDGGHPLRLRWASADGLAAEWAWADGELAALGRPRGGPVEQVRSWNLSALSRFPTADGPVWLKSTPPFAVPEAAVIARAGRADPGLVPRVLAADGRRVLLADVPGVDCWGVPEDGMLAVVDRWAAVQAAVAADGPDGLADCSPAALAERFPALLERLRPELSAVEYAQGRELAATLPELAARLDRCGLPSTLVHGDFHPGNWRFDGERPTVLDFSDAAWGHPALDGLRPAPFLSPERWADVRSRWVAAWRALAPGSRPEEALELAAPLVHVHFALRYQEFLDGIEPSEHPYHAGDPAAEVRRALRKALFPLSGSEPLGAGRELYRALMWMGDTGTAAVLDAWAAQVLPGYPERLAAAASYDAFGAQSAEEQDRLECELYALSRTADVLALEFQPPHGDGPVRDRVRLGLDLAGYRAFFTRLGMAEVGAADGFDPFLHEIAELVPAEDPDAPIELLDVLWPGFMFGELLFARAGVRVRAGARVAEPGWADASPVYWAFRRRGRRPVDLSHGWGSNSQWSTGLRMDFRTADGDRLNVVRTPERLSDHHGGTGLTRAEAEELLRHRCLLRRPAGLPELVADSQEAADFWPFHWTLPEPGACVGGCQGHQAY